MQRASAFLGNIIDLKHNQLKTKEMHTAALSGVQSMWVVVNCTMPGFFSQEHRRSISKSLDMVVVRRGGDMKR